MGEVAAGVAGRPRGTRLRLCAAHARLGRDTQAVAGLAAETNVLQGLERWGFQDAFTAANGTGLKDPTTGSYRAGCYSHHIPPGSPDPVRRRLDHMLVSLQIESVEARYYTEILEPKRENGYRWSMLSDHAPLVVGMKL